jgi:hypothetical protein
MTWATLPALVSVAIFALTCSGCSGNKLPQIEPAQAHAGLVDACKAYVLLTPAKYRTHANDVACEFATHVCDDVKGDAGLPPSVPVDVDAGQ